MGFLGDRMDNSEIRKELRKLSFLKENRIDEIIQQFWFYDYYNSLISFPPYLKHLKEFLLRKRNHKFDRSDFYNFFLEQIIGKNKERLENLQKLAVVMELAQVNDQLLENFQKAFKKLGVDQNKLNIGNLIEKNLLKWFQEENKQKSIGFYHHTIQEFLAASFILNTKDPLQTAQSLMVLRKETMVAFKPSWYGVLRFLFESKKAKEFISWMVEFADKNRQTVDDAFSDVITSINPEIVPDLKTKIFDLVYGTYFKKILWLPVWTRYQLANFCTQENLKQFQEHIKPANNETETFVHRGNIAAIIDGILQANQKLLKAEDQTFWKKKLVDFANDDNKNGVLQRHSLYALINFKDPSLIGKVAKAFTKEDNLIKEAFLRFCYRTAPNNKKTIDFLVEAINQGLDIYGRYGLYEITSKSGIKYSLEKFISNGRFLKRFLDRENIFNAEREKGDQILLNHIKNAADEKIIILLKKLISSTFSIEDIHDTGKSYFLQQLALFVQDKNPNYLIEITDEISKYKDDKKMIWHLLYNYQNLFVVLIKKRNLLLFTDKISNLHEIGNRIIQGVIYRAKEIRGEEGQEILNLALSNKLIPKPSKEDIFGKEQEQRNEEIYKEFRRLLEPKPSKYFPAVFQYYLNNREVIEKKWKTEEKKRLIKLAINEGLKKIDPKNIQVKIKDFDENKTYSISTVASYYADILRVGQILFPKKLQESKQKIINFIPYAYSDDQQTILEILPKVTNDELDEYVNKIYQDKEKHQRYLIPSSYIYIVGEYIKRSCKLNSSKDVLKSFIGDKNISENDQRYALEKIGGIITSSDEKFWKYLRDLWKESENKKIVETANAILINVFKDEEAIDWRFDQLRERIVPFTPAKPMQVHTVGPLENELSNLYFAKPLIELDDKKYLSKFFTLLEFSFEKLKEPEEKNFGAYINYLWNIVIAFIRNLQAENQASALDTIKDVVKKNNDIPGASWINSRIDTLQREHIDRFGKISDLKQILLSFDLGAEEERKIGQVQNYRDYSKKSGRETKGVLVYYADEDKKLVEQVIRQIKNISKYINIYYSDKDRGRNWIESLNSELNNRTTIVVFASRSWLNKVIEKKKNKVVQREIYSAISLEKEIIPVLIDIEPNQFNNALPLLASDASIRVGGRENRTLIAKKIINELSLKNY